MKVSLIGLGNMGMPIAENLLKSGYKLTVYNRTKSKAEEIAAKGARIASSPAEAARETGIVFTVLSDDSAAEEVTFGEEGILAGLEEGGVHVSISTLSVELAEKLSKEHAKRGQHFISSPVLGRPDAAAAAALRLMIAGPEEAQNRVMPLLECIGQDLFVIGEKAYLANVVKLGNNFLIVSMLEALSEVLTMVNKYGIESTSFLEVANALFASPVYKNYGSIMAENQFEPAGFKMKLGLKDVNLMLDAAQKVKAPLPGAELIKQHYAKGIEKGWEDLDWAALIKVLKEAGE
ncbi:NAD(P)-dependent oxidoreductase [Domibacillus sp. DTU_2020_1001157_1_SI_ALB_TIR_016]|uniref:NAD(P)-dependent oxidoreductase n=1 Tax=Domibacillus sp. DTU_2020_1001157_1_SI_ALB_TIR_016 TaxID=3077789 RepID=UPI0028ECBD30|nr:NAD(P)-dependent oxidoreductase [Domibacillus sp. DTU_2020_1001157_1_SI_ALB_TIR_016]WNS78259.1 NAD(P)-dependent oxidoreductase [Domibacillus sp. DTU_2020_1001157_1_SI_ALB_TIR_016]